MPTRLLDLSGSALAALWFAIKQPSDEPAEGQVPPAAAV
ncbi:FRG domain-containing protein [Burkholderia diffusa]|nr:FRG domain-containing protein [Burkholderia diffusa]